VCSFVRLFRDLHTVIVTVIIAAIVTTMTFSA
jgi:hypothetical protein